MKPKGIVLLVLSLLVMFCTVYYGAAYYDKYLASKMAGELLDTIKEEARESYPDELEMAAMKKVAISRSEDDLNNQKTFEDKRKKAADIFFGFYLINVKSRVEYCLDLGVNIAPFSSLFKKSNWNEYLIAKEARAYNSSDIEELYQLLEPQMMEVVGVDMKGIASENGLSVTESCQLFVDYAPRVVSQMHISAMNPAVYKALTYNVKNDLEILKETK
ncbi:hypothetical protein KDW99_08665 [Marinomonas rhizomae]|uniref:hypothetical protein n=1 Tax=Marinomonas rhizomae TaxID=491948 RepID=UPI00210801D0|nr:hypothetical protein [Marinomonas rhizomae]UTW01179.1 hypothetical protein KDW99_08665 [Marinomonas rhizomae]